MPITTDHIHLDSVYWYNHLPFSTPRRFNAVRDISPTPQIIGSYARTLTGAPVSHVLRKPSDNSVLRFIDFRYQLRVTVDDFEHLQSILGEPCLLIDIRHCADTADHTPYFKNMFLSEVRFLKPLSPELGDVLAGVELKDFYTVNPL